MQRNQEIKRNRLLLLSLCLWHTTASMVGMFKLKPEHTFPPDARVESVVQKASLHYHTDCTFTRQTIYEVAHISDTANRQNTYNMRNSKNECCHEQGVRYSLLGPYGYGKVKAYSSLLAFIAEGNTRRVSWLLLSYEKCEAGKFQTQGARRWMKHYTSQHNSIQQAHYDPPIRHQVTARVIPREEGSFGSARIPLALL